VTHGDRCVWGDVRTITRKLDFDRYTCTSIVRYFKNKGIIEQRHESFSHLVTLTSKGVDFVEITFSAAAHFFETTLTDLADEAACVLDVHT
jgi:CTP-dependent riboflavin kinase